jgi:predicted Zn-dependent protease
MSIDQQQVRDALEILGEGTRMDVVAEQSDLLRYAESRITAQHSERRLRVRVRTNRDGRSVAGSLETLDPAAVRQLADRLTSALSDLPASAEASAGVPVDHEAVPPEVIAARSVLEAQPADRYGWFTTVLNGLDDSTRLGGAIRYDVLDRVVADASGLFRAETLTKAAIQAIAQQDERSANIKMVHRDAAKVPVEEIAQRLLEAIQPLPTVDARHGSCRVLLKPQAVQSLIATFGYVALGATAYAADRSPVSGRLGEQVVSDQLTLIDDGGDAAGLSSGFDVEGNVRRRTVLIDGGVLTGVVSDRRRATITGGVPTGHAVPDGWRFGADPVPSHLLLDAGGATEDDLLAECGTGLIVNRLDYLRTLHPKEGLVTGTTRDATYWAEDGKIIGRHPQVRFTFRMSDVLNAVLAVGRDRECGETPFMESVVTPSLLIDAGPLVLP